MHIGIVGLALSHPYIFAELVAQEGHSVTAVWDADGNKAAELANRLNTLAAGANGSAAERAVAVDDPSELLPGGARTVDAVFICTPSGEHADRALPFLEAGVPTFVDKALATNVEDARRLLKAGAVAGRVLMSTSVIRFAPSHQALIRQVRQGMLGRTPWAEGLVAHDIRGYLAGPSTWQDSLSQGGGSIVNMGIHAVEPLVAAWGTPVEAVSCQTARRIYPTSQSEDTAVLTIRYADGRLGSVQVLCGCSQHGYELRVQGEKGIAAARAPSRLVEAWSGEGLGNGDANAEYGYTATVRAFLESATTRQLRIPLSETATVIGVLLAARRSAELGREVHLAELALTDH